MKKLYIFLLSISAFLCANSQSQDASFNGTGFSTIDFFKGNINYENSSKILIQKDGNFVVLFQINGFAIYAHYFSDGQLDKSFGKDGFSEPLPLSETEGVLQSSGKLVVAGLFYNQDQGAFDFAVARYNLDGTLDKTFGVNGYQKTDFFNSDDIVYSIAIQPNDKVIVGGLADNPSTGNTDFAVARYTVNGMPDNTFSGDGKQTTDFNGANEEVHALAVQSNGKIVAAGYLYNDNTGLYQMAIARYNSNGTIDNGFDGDGKKADNFTAGDNYVNGVTVQADGKIVIVGKSYDGVNENSKISLARYNVNGTLDNGFSGDGKILVDFEGVNAGRDILVQPDGKILAGGYKYSAATDSRDFAVLRFNSNGTPDNSFDKDGIATTDFYGDYDVLYKFSLLPDGKIVASGEVFNTKTDNMDLGIIQYKSDGSIDKHFGKKGWVTGYFNSGEGHINSIAIQPDGKIVVGGDAFTENLGDFAVARFNTDGTLDKTFGESGKVTTDFYGDFDGIDAIALQPDGKIVALGQAYNIENNVNEFALARYNTDGKLDKKFGRKGKQTLAVLPDYNIATSLALQPDGKIIAAGYTVNVQSDNYDIAIARFTNEGQLDNTFDGDGKRTTDFNASDDFVSGIALQNDGKIVLAGYTFSETTLTDFAIVRYNSNGTYDNSFSGDGKATFDLGGDEYVSDFKIQTDGKFVMAGEIYDPVLENIRSIVARFNANGTPDNTFDGDGKQITDFGNNGNHFAALTIQPDGKILLAGSAFDKSAGQYDIQLTRYNSNGSLDKSFDGDGVFTDDLMHYDDFTYCMAFYDNKVYVGGYIYMPSSAAFIARYLTGSTSLPITKLAEKNAVTGKADLVVKAYPNPSTQYFSVLLKGDVNNPVSLKVTDAVGRLIEIKNNIKANTLLLIGTQYKPGVYYIEVNQDGTRKILQLIKQ